MKKKLLLLLGLIGIAIGVAACMDPQQGNPEGARVAIEGDSEVFNSRDAFHAELDPSYNVQIASQIGMSSDQVQLVGPVGTTNPDGSPGTTFVRTFWNDAANLAQADPDVYILQIGTNDARGQVATATVMKNIAYMRSMQPTHTCDIAVTIPEWDTYDATPADGLTAADLTIQTKVRNLAKAENNKLRSLYSDHLVDWSAAINADRTAHHGVSTYLGDGVHPTPLGMSVEAGMIHTAINACNPPSHPTTTVAPTSTEAPTTEPPTTEPPTTEGPSTTVENSATTEAPTTTAEPTTTVEPTTTDAPTTEAPTTTGG